MKSVVIIILLCLANHLYAQGPKLLPVKINYKWGYVNMKGELVIPASFERAKEFGDRPYAQVVKNNKAGIIDSTGKEIVPPSFVHLMLLDNRSFKLSNDSLWGIKNIRGEEITPPIYSDIQKLADYYLVSKHNHWGLIDEKGKVLIEPAYDSISYNTFGFFTVHNKNKSGIINTSGSILAECKYQSCSIIDNSLILLKDDTSWSGIDNMGKPLFKNIISVSPEIIGGYILFNNADTRSLYARSTGKMISISAYHNFSIINDDFIYTFANRKMGIIDAFGKIIAEPLYINIEYIPEASLFKINKGGKWGLMNQEGKFVIHPAFDIIGKFKNNISLTKNGSRWGLINASGKIIHPCTSDRIYLNGDKAEISTDLEKIFLTFDKKGNVIDELRFKKIRTLQINEREVSLIDTTNKNFDDGFSFNAPQRYGWFQAGNGKWGLKDSTGRLWIPAFLDDVGVYPELGLSLVSINSFDRERGITVTGFGVVDNEKKKFILRPGSSVVYIEDFKDGLVARIELKSGPALLKRDGTLITHMEVKDGAMTKSMKIAYVGNFSEDKARVKIGGDIKDSEHGYWGYIGRDGGYEIKAKYQYAQDFKQGRSIVKLNYQWGLIDGKGEWVIANTYDHITYVPFSQDSLLYLKSNKKKSGILTSEGKISIDPRYDDIGTFCEGFAKAKEKGKWGYINSQGDTLKSFTFSDVGDFHEGMAAVKLNNKWGYIDSTGKMMIAPTFDLAGDFHNGISYIKKKGKFGYINTAGYTIIETKYINAGDFSGKIAAARTRKRFGILNTEGKWLIRPSFKKVAFCGNGYAIVKKKRYGMVNPEGKLILKCKYKHIEPFSESLAAITTKDGRSGFIDSTGSIVIPIIYKNAGSFNEGLASVLIGSKYGYINKKGEVVIGPTFKKCSAFIEGKAYASTNTSNGFIDSTGRLLIPLKSFSPFYFSEGMSLVNENKKYFFINEDGKPSFNNFFKDALPYKHGLSIVNTNGKYGVIDREGMKIVNAKYDKIEAFKNDYAELIKLDFQGIGNITGKIIVSPDFEVIEYIPSLKVFRVEKGDAIGYLDREGRWIWNPCK